MGIFKFLKEMWKDSLSSAAESAKSYVEREKELEKGEQTELFHLTSSPASGGSENDFQRFGFGAECNSTGN